GTPEIRARRSNFVPVMTAMVSAARSVILRAMAASSAWLQHMPSRIENASQEMTARSALIISSIDSVKGPPVASDVRSFGHARGAVAALHAHGACEGLALADRRSPARAAERRRSPGDDHRVLRRLAGRRRR